MEAPHGKPGWCAGGDGELAIDRKLPGIDSVNRWQGGFSVSSAALSAADSWELAQAIKAWCAIDAQFGMRTQPKATAAFANFQMQIEIHDDYSRSAPSPAERSASCAVRRVSGKDSRLAGFERPAGGWRLASRTIWSCSWRRDPGSSGVAESRAERRKRRRRGGSWGCESRWLEVDFHDRSTEGRCPPRSRRL